MILGILSVLFVLYILPSLISYIFSLRQKLDERNRSENEILFDCEADILNNRMDHRQNVSKFIIDWNLFDGRELNNNFSHDNWIGMYSYYNYFSHHYKMKHLPLFGHHSIRPDNFAFFFYAKHPILGFLPYLPIVSLSCIVSTMRVFKKKGDTVPTTSGKLLSYFKAKSFNLKLTKKVMDKFIDSHEEYDRWRGVFDIYFADDHRVWQAYIGSEK